jgi:UDP-N-acetylglucosamine/UDP-N-acetylgalactosamine diphosphorylase
MEKNGVDYIFNYCVDNILIKILDPSFIALSIENEVDFSTKVISKRLIFFYFYFQILG